MNKTEQKIAQYLGEAHAMEQALVTVLRSQIAMAPGGSYRDGLESHLRETREHATRVERRLDELGRGSSPIQAGVGLIQSVVGQALALGKTPLDLVRGTGGEEKVLKNAKDACATEALEIATYTAIGRLASSVGDKATRALADSIRADEQRMLDRILKEIPKLTEAVVRSELPGNPSSERASEGDLAIVGYDKLTAAEIVEKLASLSQVELAKINSYERKNGNRKTILSRISSLRGDEPWPGYDDLGVDEVRAVLDDGDEGQIKRVRSYERSHKNRTGVIDASERELATA